MGPRSDDSTTPAITFATPKRAISSGIDRTLPKPSFNFDESCDVSETFHTPKGGPCESRQDTPRPYQEARFQESVFSRDSSPGKSKFLKSQSSKQPFFSSPCGHASPSIAFELYRYTLPSATSRQLYSRLIFIQKFLLKSIIKRGKTLLLLLLLPPLTNIATSSTQRQEFFNL